ncbi:hypothetical protein EDD18DRAFT_24318 [Armillaria luteobubalina]|uniref:Uncharacterized protein n=1 Tax=Armillaria luteobubalina TaxID=153913 RepID=A0AA39V5A2_9AGAR|nr:hypothetical protein EDD18DRAFT_24318 [Armillaria luteobubalina]
MLHCMIFTTTIVLLGLDLTYINYLRRVGLDNSNYLFDLPVSLFSNPVLSMSAPDMDFTACAEEAGIPIDAILVPSFQFIPWRPYNGLNSSSTSSTQQTHSYDPYYVPPRAPSPESYIHPLRPPPRRPRAHRALLQETADTDAHSDLVPSAPPPSPTTPNLSEAGSKVFVPNFKLLDLTEFGVCRLQMQSPLAMEDSKNLDEEHTLRDHSELWTHSCPAEQKNGSQLMEERLSDDDMEIGEENRNGSDDDMEELMEVASTANGRPCGYAMKNK